MLVEIFEGVIVNPKLIAGIVYNDSAGDIYLSVVGTSGASLWTKFYNNLEECENDFELIRSKLIELGLLKTKKEDD